LALFFEITDPYCHTLLALFYLHFGSQNGTFFQILGPYCQTIRTKLARRANTSESNWPVGPVHQTQTGPKGQYIRTKLARRASTSGGNWPEGPVHQDQTGPKYGSEYTTFFTVVLSTAYYLPLKTRNSKLEIETRHRNSKLKLDIEIRNGNSKLKLRLEIKTQAVWS